MCVCVCYVYFIIETNKCAIYKQKVCIVKYSYKLRCIYIIFRESLLIYAQVIWTQEVQHIGIAPTRHIRILSITYTATTITTFMCCKYNYLTQCTTF